MTPNYHMKSDTFFSNLTKILEKKFKKCLLSIQILKHLTFSMIFQNTHFPIAIFKIKSKHPNLTSNFEPHKNVGDKFLLHIYKYIYTLYIYPPNIKKLEHCLYPVPCTKLALRTRGINPRLDPGGSGKQLAREGSGTERLRLVTV